MTPFARALLCNLAIPAALAASASAAPAPRPAPPALFTLEHALTMRTISDLTWSADGRRLAFVVNAPDTAENTGNQDLWLLDLAAGAARRLTRHPTNDLSPTFSPGGDTIAFVATRGTGDEPKPAIYMLSLEGGDPWAFGSYDEAVGEVSWSPDGRWLAFVKTDTLARSIREWQIGRASCRERVCYPV